MESRHAELKRDSLLRGHAALVPLTSVRFIFLQPGQIEFTRGEEGARPSFLEDGRRRPERRALAMVS